MKRLLAVGALVVGALALTKGVVVLADEPGGPHKAARQDEGGSPGATVGDDAITTSIKGQFLASTDLRRVDISVTTSNGVVTLRGMVPSDDVRREALDMARHTGGVVRADDQMRVLGSRPSNPEVPLH